MAHDTKNHFTFDTPVCPVCAGLDRFQRIQADADDAAVKALGEKPRPDAKRPADGRKLYVRQLPPR